MKRHAPVIVLILISLVGLINAALVSLSAERAQRARFAGVAQEATNRIEERISRHMLLIDATVALFEAKAGLMSVDDFSNYFRNLRLAERSAGSVGLGYVVFANRSDFPLVKSAFEQNVKRPLDLDPGDGLDYIAVAVMFESAFFDASPLSGTDFYADIARRVAMDRAIAEHEGQATEPLKLEQDQPDARTSFVVYAPVYGSNFGIPASESLPQLPTGFVFGAFRTADLLRAAVHRPPLLPVHMTVTDADTPGHVLYEYGQSTETGSNIQQVRKVLVAGQEWILTFRPGTGFPNAQGRILAALLAAGSLLLAIVAAALLHEHARAQAAAELLARNTQQNLAQKELLLQEMKHRIKNAVARILAIARQTAAHSEDLASFTQTFTERLQAMATAQDALTRSTWQQADLRDLLTRELAQVLGDDFEPASLDGPDILLDERTTQALGLTFHELATNALKYGGLCERTGKLRVIWKRMTSPEGQRNVVIEWRENGGDGITAPEHDGFGTRLIYANVRHELEGEVEREFLPSGLLMRLKVPLASAPKRAT